MQPSQTIADRLTRKLPLLVFLFCVMQPVLDVLGFWQLKLSISNEFTLILRALLLVLMLVFAFWLTRRRKLYLLLTAVLLAYLAAHVTACICRGYADPLEDLAEQARIVSLPVTTVCFITFLERSDETFDALKKGFAADLAIILLVELLAAATGTDPHTYKDKSLGILGWFVWANSQSAILSLTVPVVIAWACRRFRGKLPVLAAICLTGFAMLFFIATRLAFLTMAVTGLGLAVCIVIADRSCWKQALTVLLCAAIFTALYPVSPMKQNRDLVKANAAIKQERLSAAAAEYGVGPDERTTDNEQALAAVYKYNLQGLVDRFGLDRTAEIYDRSIDQSKVFDRRLKQLQYCRLLMQDAPTASRLFGLEISEMWQDTLLYDFHTDRWEKGVDTFDSENDVFSIYYECGLTGLILLALFMLTFLARALTALVRRGKAVFTVDYAAFCAAFAFAAVYAFGTVSVLRRNNASVYFALILAGVWHLTRGAIRKPKEASKDA